MSERRHKQVVNIEEIAPRDEGRGQFGYRARRLGPEAGGRALGCSLFEVAPGKTSFPFHFHACVEEALYILEGTATVRIGADSVVVRAGDYVAFPPGPDCAHTLTNTGTATLRYLAMSAPGTPVSTDVCVYPDSKKVAFAAGVDPVKGWRGGAWAFGMIREQPAVDYYDGEPLATPADD